jgi:uncharacterized protein (UPF0333 family)
MLMKNFFKGQTSVEYLMLVGGSILFAAAVAYVVKTHVISGT